MIRIFRTLCRAAISNTPYDDPYLQLKSDPEKAQAGLSDLPILDQAIEDAEALFDNDDFATASKCVYYTLCTKIFGYLPQSRVLDLGRIQALI